MAGTEISKKRRSAVVHDSSSRNSENPSQPAKRREDRARVSANAPPPMERTDGGHEKGPRTFYHRSRVYIYMHLTVYTVLIQYRRPSNVKSRCWPSLASMFYGQGITKSNRAAGGKVRVLVLRTGCFPHSCHFWHYYRCDCHPALCSMSFNVEHEYIS